MQTTDQRTAERKVKRSPERAADDNDDEDLETASAGDQHQDVDQAGGDPDAGDVDQDAVDNDGADQGDHDEPGETDEAADERRARAMGWVPLNEWRGDKRRWKPASEFLEKAIANAPVFEERLDKISEELADTKAKLKESTEVLTEMNERQKTSFNRGYESARKELLAKRKQAVADADTEGFEAIDTQIKDLDEEHEKVVAPKKTTTTEKSDTDDDPAKKKEPKIAPEMLAWKDKNKWFDEDDEMASVAMAIERRLIKEKKGGDLAGRLDLVTREIRRRYPERFTNPRREAPSAVNGGGDNRRGSGRKGRTVADLPADAKQALAKFKRTIPGYTDEQYLKEYEWDD